MGIIIALCCCSISALAIKTKPLSLKRQYYSVINNVTFKFDNYELQQVKEEEKTYWVINQDSRYEVDNEKYHSTKLIKLTVDCKLFYYNEIMEKDNNTLLQTLVSFSTNGYKITTKNRNHTVSEQEIITDDPLFYDVIDNPFLLELYIKEHISGKIKVLKFSGEISEIILPTIEQFSIDSQTKKTYFKIDNSKMFVNQKHEINEMLSTEGVLIYLTTKDFSFDQIQNYSKSPNLERDNNVFFLKPQMLTELHVQIKSGLDYQGKKAFDTLNSPRQVFIGTAQTANTEGELIIKAKPNQPANSEKYPYTKSWPENMNEYLGNGPLITINEDIRNTAKNITSESQNIWDAARRIGKWVVKNKKPSEVYVTSDSVETLKTMTGQCVQYSVLTVALCRSVNIPARMIVGYLIDNHNKEQKFDFMGHAWVEVYMGENNGWVAIDSAMNEIDFVSAAHIGLKEDEGMIFRTLKREEIKIIDFKPITAAAVPKDKFEDLVKYWEKVNELQYKVVNINNGKILGGYRARVQKSSGEQRDYKLIEYLEMDNGKTQLNSELTLDALGYASHYYSNGMLSGKKYTFELQYNDLLKRFARINDKEFQGDLGRIYPQELPVDIFRITQWAPLLRNLISEDKSDRQYLTVFMPDRDRYITAEIKIRPTQLNYKGKIDKGWIFEISGGQLETRIWMTEDGIIVKAEFPDANREFILEDDEVAMR